MSTIFQELSHVSSHLSHPPSFWSAGFELSAGPRQGQGQIHWFAILNSLLILVFLCLGWDRCLSRPKNLAIGVSVKLAVTGGFEISKVGLLPKGITSMGFHHLFSAML